MPSRSSNQRSRGRGMPRPTPGLIAAGVLLLVLLGGGVAAAMTMASRIDPGHVGVIVNNITGGTRVQDQPGMVYHLPFGMTDVHTLDSTLQVFEMAAKPQISRTRGGQRRRPSGDEAPTLAAGSVKVKTSDGGDVYMDLSINYQIDVSKAADIVQRIGTGGAYKGRLMKAYARSRIRDAMGRLTIVEISDAGVRTQTLDKVRQALQDDLGSWGLKVLTVSATNFSFNPRYEKLIRERKNVDQEIRNQAAAQETARREQETAINAAEREKNVELLRIDGQMEKNLIEARGQAEEKKRRAEGEAYRVRKQGDREYATASAEAQAVEAEGLKRAEGVRELTSAYSEGGLALVLEALAKKYVGRTIEGRPYDLESRVERLRLEGDDRFASGAAAGKGGER